MLGQQPEFLFRHGIIPAHGDDSLVVVPDAVNQRHFLFFKGFGACCAVIVGNPHSCFPFHHAVGIGKLPVKSVGEYFGRPALSRPHRPDQDYISLFIRTSVSDGADFHFISKKVSFPFQGTKLRRRPSLFAFIIPKAAVICEKEPSPFT